MTQIVYIVDPFDAGAEPAAFESEIHAQAYAKTYDAGDGNYPLVTAVQIITDAEAGDIINARLETF